MLTIVKIINNKYHEYRKTWELHKYNSFTIAEYFRKQGAQIGEGCRIIPTSLGREPYLIKIGNRVAIAAGVSFHTHDGGAWIFRDEIPDLQVFGSIIIEDECIIGAYTQLFPNTRIGRKSIIAAGSVVISDIPPESIVMGAPARVIGSIHKYKTKCIAQWKQQKPPDIFIEPGANWWNSKHYQENLKKLERHLTKLFNENRL